MLSRTSKPSVLPWLGFKKGGVGHPRHLNFRNKRGLVAWSCCLDLFSVGFGKVVGSAGLLLHQ